MKKNVINLILVAVNIVLLNLVLVELYLRLDLTADSSYTLSSYSKKVLDNLDDKLVIKCYFSPNLPNQVADVRRYTSNLLEEYRLASHGRLSFEFVNAQDDAQLTALAKEEGIQPVSIRVQDKGELQLKQCFLGLAFMYKDQHDIIPVVSTSQGLEYDITNTIRRVSDQQMTKVAIFRDGKATGTADYNEVAEFLGGSYNVSFTDLNRIIDKDVGVLIVPGVGDSLADNQLLVLDAYLLRGGAALFTQRGVVQSSGDGGLEPNHSNLLDLLAGYGIRIKNNVVADARCGELQVNQYMAVKYPYYPRVNNLADNPTCNNVPDLTFYYPSEIDTLNLPAGLNQTILARSSYHSGTATGEGINPKAFLEGDTNLETNPLLQERSKALAVLYTGHLVSRFRGLGADKQEQPPVQSDKGRILLLADSDFLRVERGMQNQGNIMFLQNAIDYLAGDEDIIGLRSRMEKMRLIPTDKIPPYQREAIKWLNILLPAVLAAIMGLLVWRRQRQRRLEIRSIYEKN